jgi:hypothetical protein
MKKEEIQEEWGGNIRFLKKEQITLYNSEGKIFHPKCKCGNDAVAQIIGKESFIWLCSKCLG